MPPGGHLRPLGGGFLITVAAHKCGLHQNKMINWIVRINFASAHKCGLHLKQKIYCSLECHFASAHKCGLHRQYCTKMRYPFCRLRCESVDSFSGITKDACADYFPVLFYCQGNQRCHYRQSRTDNRPVFYGANCTGFFCKLLLRTYARMLLRIPILESVFGISDNLRID